MEAEAQQQQQQQQGQQQEGLPMAQQPSTPHYHTDYTLAPSPSNTSLKTPESSINLKPRNRYNGPSYTLVMSQIGGQLRNKSPEPRSPKSGGNHVSASSRISSSSSSSNGRLTTTAKSGNTSPLANMQRASSQPLPAGIGSNSRSSGSTRPFSGKYKFTVPSSSSTSSKSASVSPQISPRRRSAVQSAVAIQKLAVSLADAGIDDPEVLALAACYKNQGDAKIPAANGPQQRQQQQQQQQRGGVAQAGVTGDGISSSGSSPFSPFSAVSAVSNNTTDAGMVWGNSCGANSAGAAAAGSSQTGASKRSAAGSSLSASVAARVVSIFGSESVPADVTAAAAAAATSIKARAAAAAAAVSKLAAAPQSPKLATITTSPPRGLTTRPLSPSVAAATASAAARPVSPAAAALVASEEIVGIPQVRVQPQAANNTSPAVRPFAAAAAAAAETCIAEASSRTLNPNAEAAAAADRAMSAAPAAQTPAAVSPYNYEATEVFYTSTEVSTAGASSATSAAGDAAAAAAAAASKLSSNTRVFDLKKQLEDLQQSLTAAKAAGEKEAAGIAAARVEAAEKGSASGSSASGSKTVTSVDDSVMVPVRHRAPAQASLMGLTEADWGSSAAAAAPAPRSVLRETLDNVTGSITPSSSTNGGDPAATVPRFAGQTVISNNGYSSSSKLESGGSAFSSSSWGSANSSAHTAISGSSTSRPTLPLSYELQIRSNVADHRPDHRVLIDPLLRPSGSPLKSIAEQHELLNSGSSGNGNEAVSTGGTELLDNSRTNSSGGQEPQDGANGLRIKIRSDSRLTGSTPVSEVERSDPRMWANTFFPGSASAAAVAAAAASGAAATAAAMDGSNSRLNTINTTSTGVSLFVTEVKYADSASQIKNKKARGSNSSGEGSCSSGGSVWRIGTCSIPSLSTTAFHKFHPQNDQESSDGSSTKWINRKVFLRILLPVLILLAAVSIGIGAWAGVKHQRAKIASAAIQPLGFEAVLVTSSADGDHACGRWFADAEHIHLYRRVFAAAYASALGVDMTADNIMTITCAGSTIYTSSSGSSSSSSSGASRAPARHLMATAAARTEALGRDPTSLSSNASLIPSSTAAAAADRSDQRKDTAPTVNVVIVTIFNVPAPVSAKDSISKAVAAASAGILINPLSKFFDGPTALRGAVRSLDPAASAAASASSSAAPASGDPGEVLHGASGTASDSMSVTGTTTSSSSGTEVTAAASVDSSITPQAMAYTPNDAPAAAAAAADVDSRSAKPSTTADATPPSSSLAAAAAASAAVKQQKPKKRASSAQQQQQQQQQQDEENFVPVAATAKQSSRPKVIPSDVQATLLPPETLAAAPVAVLPTAMRVKKPAAAAVGSAGQSKVPLPPPAAAAAAAAAPGNADLAPTITDYTAAVTAAAAAAASSATKPATAASKKPKAAADLTAPAAAAESEALVTADPVVIVDNPVITVEPTAAAQTRSKKAAAPTEDVDTFSPPAGDTAAAGEGEPVPVAEAQPVVVVPDQPTGQAKTNKAPPAGNTFDPVYTPGDSSKNKSAAPACPFASTKTNSYSDSNGHLWGFANGKDCIFKQQ